MTTTFARIRSGTIRGIPTVITLAVLAGVAYIGHRYEWKIPALSQLGGESAEHREDWCMEHGVPESSCLICRGLKVNGVPPSQQVEAGSTTGGEGSDAAESAPRRGVQLASAETASRVGIEVAAATTQPMVDAIEANAEIMYDMTKYAQIASRVDGTASLVSVQVGQRVRAGEVLAVVNSAEVGNAKAGLLSAAARVASRRAILERMETSTEKGFRNQADLLAAQADLQEASIELFNARQALINLGLPMPAIEPGQIPVERDVLLLGLPPELVAQLDGDRISANLIPILSPLEGVVIARHLVPGEAVEEATTLFVVADTGRMWVHADLALAQAVHVKVGQEMSFVPDLPGAEPVIGKVIWINPEVSEKTRTVQVRGEIENIDNRLFAKSFGRARIALRASAAAVVVPEAAVQHDDTGCSIVFVRLNGEVFEAREIQTGARSSKGVEVMSGLKEGEPVAIAGTYALLAQLNREKLGAGCTDD